VELARPTRIDAQAEREPAAVIVSVYKDVQALRCILRALREQTGPRFQVIVSEDGQCQAMRQFIDAVRPRFPALIHLTQEDRGFRKTRALNRAVRAATADRLIFIDGDCVPHRRFVQNHLRYAGPKTVCAGRRVQLGPRLSLWLRNRPARITVLQNRFCYLLLAAALHLDGGRNYEIGLVSPLLQSLRGPDPRYILGCNFSCSKEDLLAINGFNEDYVQPGVGEDTDLEWRFQQAGVRLKSVRFVTPVYHLHHESSWTTSEENQRILASTKGRGEVYCTNGIVKRACSKWG
jgi:GT2 family glycosyltransferase